MARQEVIDRGIPTRGINLQDDEFSLTPGEAVELDNYMVNTGALTTRSGSARLNSTSLSGSVTGGIYATFSSGASEFVVAATGALYSVTNAGAVVPLTLPTSYSLSANITLMEMFQDKVLILPRGGRLLAYNGGDDPFVPETLSPYLSKLLHGFETSNAWTIVSGNPTLQTDTNYQTEGRAALGVSANSSQTSFTISTDLGSTGLFDYFDDGTAVEDVDYISLDVYGTSLQDVIDLYICFGPSSSNSTDVLKVNVRTVGNSGWPDSLRASEAFTVRVRKSHFSGIEGGTATWGNSRYFFLSAVYSSGSAPQLVFDNLRIERSGPIATPICLRVAACNGRSDNGGMWDSMTNFRSSGGADKFLAKEGGTALALPPNTMYGLNWDPGANFSVFPTEEAVQPDDVLSFWMCRSTEPNRAEPQLIVRLQSAGSNDAYSAYFGVSKVPNWSQYTIPLSSFANANLSAITRLSFESVGGNTTHSTLYIDKVEILPTRASTVILSIDPTDRGDFANQVSPPSTDNTSLAWETSGGTTSLKLTATSTTSATAVWTFNDLGSGYPDLSTYKEGDRTYTSLNTDKISLRVYIASAVRTINYLKLEIDGSGSDAAWTRYFTYTMEGATIEVKRLKEKDFWLNLEIKKSDFTQIPKISDNTPPTWGACRGVRIILAANKKRTAIVYVDSLTMTRGGNLTGVFSYKATYVNKRNVESAPSLASTPTDYIENMDIYVNNIPSAEGSGASQIQARRLYRTGQGSTEWKLVAQIAGNEKDDFIDDLPDTDLGGVMEQYENTTFRASAMCKYGNRIALGNLINPMGYEYRSGYVLSKSGSYEVFDEASVIEVSPLDGQEIIALVQFEGELHILKEGSHWKHREGGQPRQLHGEYGLSAPLAWTIAGNALYYWSKPYGIIRWDGVQHERFGIKQAKPLLDEVPQAYIQNVQMTYYNDHLLIAFTPAGETRNTKVLWCYLPEGVWGTFSGVGMHAGVWIHKKITGELFFGQSDAGYILKAFSGAETDPGGAAIETTYASRQIEYAMPEVTKEGHRIYINGAKLADVEDDAVLDVNFLFDGELMEGRSAAVSLNSVRNTHARITLPSPGRHVFYTGYKITAARRHVLRTLTMTAVSLEAR